MSAGPGFWSMTIGDLATWFGAAASAAAAIAAWYAARKAVDLAEMPIAKAREEREATSRIFAEAIEREMQDIARAAGEFKARARDIFRTGAGNGHQYLRTVSLNPMLATARALPFINCFNSRHAAMVIGVVAAKGAFDDRVGRLGRIEVERINVTQDLEDAIRDAENCADELAAAAEAAAEAMLLYVRV